LQQEGGLPQPESLIHKLLDKHKIDPEAAPLPKLPEPPTPLAPGARAGRGVLNLTDLADERGLDIGSARHSFTDLYHMLLQPRRETALKLLLIGLDGYAAAGDEEAWGPIALTTLDMWRSYFPKAKITALDTAKALPKKVPRVTYHSCDLEDPEAIAACVDAAPDVVIDDATHASHHQQNALRAIWPKLAEAGLYVIEDLRTQPPSREKQGYVKTSALFQGYLATGVCDHPDQDATVDLNGMRADVSGCFVFQAKFQKHRRDQILVLHKR